LGSSKEYNMLPTRATIIAVVATTMTALHKIGEFDMAQKTLSKIRIFAASPSDVATERAALAGVVAQLQPLADYVNLSIELLDWHAVIPDAGRPQQIIFD
jgi:hypothetical protein